MPAGGRAAQDKLNSVLFQCFLNIRCNHGLVISKECGVDAVNPPAVNFSFADKEIILWLHGRGNPEQLFGRIIGLEPYAAKLILVHQRKVSHRVVFQKIQPES